VLGFMVQTRVFSEMGRGAPFSEEPLSSCERRMGSEAPQLVTHFCDIELGRY
jgi:hypothetical protein